MTDDIKLRPDRPGTTLNVDLPTTSPFDSELVIIPRDQWGAEPPKWETPLPWLPSFVRFIHTESTFPCQDRESCVREVKELQKKDQEEGLPDINFSFLVGEGGTIYEGRGWKLDLELPDNFREVQGKCISIAYMGHYKYESPPWEKLIGAFNLITHGINYKLLSPFLDFQHLIFDNTG